MRRTLSVGAGAAALAVVVLLLPLTWIATHVASEDGYVDFTSDMVRDDDFRENLISATADQIVTSTGTPSGVADVVADALSAAASQLTATQAFHDAWAETQRRSHRAVFADPRELPAELNHSNRLVIDVAPIAEAIINAASGQLAVSLDVPGQMFVTVGGSEQRQLIDVVSQTPHLSLLVGAVAFGLAALAMAAARRRWMAMGWLAVGVVAAAAAVRLIGHLVVPEVLKRSGAPTDLARSAQDLLVDQALSSMDAMGRNVMIAAGVAAAAAFVAHGLRRTELRR